jgi:uncharacterized DUF497 family protein
MPWKESSVTYVSGRSSTQRALDRNVFRGPLTLRNHGRRPKKVSANLTKHGISFEEASRVFADPNAMDGQDLHHSVSEIRLLRLGRSALRTIFMVAYTLRRAGNGETIRIISARRARRNERAAYATTKD